MRNTEIKLNETYLFVATDAPARKYLEGSPFTVVEMKRVWRRSKRKSKKVMRFFNADGVGARADELEPMPEGQFIVDQTEVKYNDDGSVEMSITGGIALPAVEFGMDFNNGDSQTVTAVIDNRENPCPQCETGEMKCTGHSPNQFGQTEHYECNSCGHQCSFP